MKRTLTGLGIVLLFSFMLLSPKAVFSGQATDFLLWFQTILPTLFPFLLVSNLLLATGSIHYLTSAFSKICRTFLSVSDCGSFAVITGFLCGYPMGAKTVCRSEYTRIYHASGSLLSSLFLQQYKPCFYYELYRLSDTGRRNASAPHTVHPPCQSALCKSDHKMYLQNVAYRSCRKPKYVRAIRRFFHPCRRAVERARLFFPAARSLHHGQL